MSDFLKLLCKRRSIRKFTNEEISDKDIETLKKALLLSPTGKNLNEWVFIQITNKNKLKELSKSKAHGSALISGASLAFVIIGDSTKSDVWIEDCSIASIILQLQVEEMGLGSCWVQIRNRQTEEDIPSEDYVRSLLDIPSHYGVLSIVAIGHKEKERKPFDLNDLQYDKIHIDKF